MADNTQSNLDKTAADQAQFKRWMMSYFDVDIDNIVEVRQLKSDIKWARTQRERCSTVWGKALTTAVLLVVSALMALLMNAVELRYPPH
jgi:type IV secretory pathway TrbF-like protein